VLCQGRGEERDVDQGGGRDLDRLHQGPSWRRRKVERRATARRPAEVRQELPAPVAKLPPARYQAWQYVQRGGGPHHTAAQAPGQQVNSFGRGRSTLVPFSKKKLMFLCVAR
jgi:hypothetical protein